MMTGIFLLGGLFLAWAFGRNNFSNVFGSAVGTGIISFRFGAFLTGVFLFLGVFWGSNATSEMMSGLAHFTSLQGAFYFSLIVALIMIFLTMKGIPASVAQISVGGLVGWNLAFNQTIFWNKVGAIAFGWFYSPIIALIIAFTLFKGARFYLKYHPIPILRRDIYVRLLWGVVGSFTAYSLGVNNLPVLITPYRQTLSVEFENILPLLFSVAAAIGCLMASYHVIRMVSSRLFPLSSVESLIVGFSGALTLLLFSFQNGILPALPISMSAALIGAIIGISLGKGGYGLKGRVLLSIIASWIWAPLFSGLLCFGIVHIMNLGRF